MKESPRRASARLSSPKKASPRMTSQVQKNRPILEELKQNSPTKNKRKSLGRRVSFAATAHVRLFDKDAEGWEKDTYSDDIPNMLNIIPGSAQKLDLSMPDLSSVRRNSETFDLRLSLPGQEPAASHEEEKEESSFEISVKGTPNSSMRMDQYGSVHQNSSILASQSRRDTIAGFFNENDSSPVKQQSENQGSNFKDDTVNMDISSPVTGHYSFLNSAASVENSPAPLVEKKQKYRARDSIACFFESPKYRSIVKSNRDSDEDSQDGQDIESCEEMETSSQSSITEDIPHEKSEKSNISLEPETKSSQGKSKTPSPKSSRRSSRRYSMSPSPLKEKSPTRSSPRARLAQAMSSPYTPKVRSKLSQCISLIRETFPCDEKHETEEPLTQSDYSLSQNTILSSQEPSLSRELFNFKPKTTSISYLEPDKDDNESIRNEHEDNLMDEQLSIGEASFSQELPIISEIKRERPISTLSEFYNDTGIRFMDNIITSFRRESTAFAMETGAPSDAEYAKAAAVWFPELEIFEFGCKELSQYIEEGKTAMRERESEIAISTPLIFYEVCEGTKEEREELMVNLKSTKSFTRLETKESWYTWREKLLGPLEESLDENIERLSRDQRYVHQFDEHMEGMIQESNAYLQELESKISEIHLKRNADYSDRKSALERLQEEEDHQIKSIAQLKSTLESLKSKAAVEVLNEEAMIVEESLVKEAIMNAEETCKELTLFEPDDLLHLKQEFRLLFLTHRWIPTLVSNDKISMSYDLTIQVTFDYNGEAFYPKLMVDESIPEVLRVTQVLAKLEDKSQVIEFWGVYKIQKVLSAYQKSFEPCFCIEDFKRTLENTQKIWEKLKMLTLDIHLAREECIIKILEGDSSSPLQICITFFSYEKNTRFTLSFSFLNSLGDISYPYGHWKWTFNNAFGDVTEFQIAKCLSSLTNGQRLTQVCQSIKQLIK